MIENIKLTLFLLLFTLLSYQCEAGLSAPKEPFIFYSLESATNKTTKNEQNTEKQIFDLIFNELPEYELIIKSTNYKTALNNAKASKNVCIRNIVHTKERSKELLFSKPQTLFLGLRLFFGPHLKDSSIEQFQNKTLTAIINMRPDLRIGIEYGRAYGSNISKELKKIPAKNKYQRTGSDGQNIMIYMLLKGRVDMILEYPEVISYKADQIKNDLKLRSIDLMNSAPLIFGRMACSQSSKARVLIEKVNLELEKLYTSEEFKQAHLVLIKGEQQSLFLELLERFLQGVNK